MSLEQVVQLLESTLNPDETIRRQAESTLEGAKKSDFGQLLQTLAVVLFNETVSSTSRVVAATYIKNSLTGRSQQFKDAAAEQWEKVDAKIRDNVKGYILNSLVAKDSQVCNATALTLATLALLELPKNRWQDLIQNLCLACNPANADQLKISALKTLGYICEEIDEASIIDKLPGILTAVVSNMSGEVKNGQVRLTALQALGNMSDLLNPLFQEKSQRDVLMGVLLQNCVGSDEDIKKEGLTVLTDFITQYYPHISDYMNAVFELTIPVIKQCEDDNDEVVKQAIEVWISIADIEADKAANEDEAARDGTVVDDLDKSRRYIEGALMPLLEALFVPLTKQDPDSEDDEWNVSHAAATCISYAAFCVGVKIIPPILQLFQTNVMNSDWRVRDAATIAFGSILEGPPTSALQPYLSDAKLLQLFLDNMKDANLVVRSSTAWTLARMCELHVGIVVTDPTRFEAVYQAFKNGLSSEPRMATMCTWGIMVLAQALDELILSSSQKVPNPLSAHFAELVDILFSTGSKPDCSARQRKGIYQALGALVHCSSADCLSHVAKVTEKCLALLGSMTAAASFPDKKDADEFEALVSGLMTECVQKLEGNVSPIADSVCSAYLTLYSKAAGANAQEEAVLGLGSFAMALERKVERFAEQICKVLLECIQKPNELDVCKAAVGSLGDVARSLEDGFSNYVAGFVPVLFSLLTSSEVDRSLFSPVVSTLGDIAQSSTKMFKAHLPQVIHLVNQAMLCKVNMNDEDDRDFLFELQESCFTCIAGISGGLATIGASRDILGYSGYLTNCITTAYNIMDRPESLSRAIVGAICDLVIAAGPSIKQVMGPGKPWDAFPQMINTILQNAQENMTKENCKYALEQIQRNLQS